MQLPNKWDVTKEANRIFGKRLCSVPFQYANECSREIAQAHTVPRSGSLAKIARDGHVYSFVFPKFEPVIRNHGMVLPELLGVHQASTFTGFCTRHDDAIFAPIEKTAFVGTPEQCFLLGYRATSREFYTKQGEIRINQYLRQTADQGKPLIEQIGIQTSLASEGEALALGLSDIQGHKNIFDDKLLKSAYEDVRAYIIEFANPTPVMCSGGVFPEEDFDGNVLQSLDQYNKSLNQMTYSSFASNDRGYLVFSWLPDSDNSCMQFIESLTKISDFSLSGALIRFLFEFCENTHMSPSWWDALPEPTRKALLTRMNIAANPTKARLTGHLKDDGIHLEPWLEISRKSVGF